MSVYDIHIPFVLQFVAGGSPCIQKSACDKGNEDIGSGKFLEIQRND